VPEINRPKAEKIIFCGSPGLYLSKESKIFINYCFPVSQAGKGGPGVRHL
jgi:hypothetical protein